MAYLNYVNDQDLIKEVKYILDKAREKRKVAEKDFNKNVIDPFGALFESPVFGSHAQWRPAEIGRQCQKIMQNHVGSFHQKILGYVPGWKDTGVGQIIDLVCKERKIIAEVKNKYNTVSGGQLADQYRYLSDLVFRKESTYKNYCAYFVTIIPKIAERVDKPFTPPDKERESLVQQKN